MQSHNSGTPDPVRTILMRRVAERLGTPSLCPTRACRRARACKGEADDGIVLPCQRAACIADRAEFDVLLATVDAIRDRTLWPEPSRSGELRAVEAVAIDIVRTALPVMPELSVAFADWLERYRGPPSRSSGTRAWFRYARAEIARVHDDGISGDRRDGRQTAAPAGKRNQCGRT